MKAAYMLWPRIGTLMKYHMMNLHKLVWNGMNVGLVYMSLNCYKLWWIVDNIIKNLKWCWKGWIEENLAKWTCVNVCVVRWKVINGVWFGEVLCPSRVRNIGRGKHNVSLTFRQREGSETKNNFIHRYWFHNRQQQGLRWWFLSRQQLKFINNFCISRKPYMLTILTSAEKLCYVDDF